MTHNQSPCSYEEILEYYKNPNNRSIEQSILSLELKPISIGPGHFTQGYGWFDTRKKFLDWRDISKSISRSYSLGGPMGFNIIKNPVKI